MSRLALGLSTRLQLLDRRYDSRPHRETIDLAGGQEIASAGCSLVRGFAANALRHQPVPRV